MKHKCGYSGTALLLSLWSAAAFPVDEQQVKQTIEEAQAIFDKAVAEQGGWVSTKKLLKSAQLSAAKGAKEKAMALAEKAKREAQLSYQQALNQKQKWSEPSYIKD
jgi:hypothetical protein